MILEDILNTYQWSPYGIECPTHEAFLFAHTFLREAVLDRHINVCKVIGFEVISPTSTRAHVGTYIAKHQLMGESYPELMVLFGDKIFLTDQSKDISCEVKCGPNSMNQMQLVSDGEPVQAIYVNPHVCRVLDKFCKINFKVLYDCGYRSSQANSKRIGSKYFPCYTDFSLEDFVRILPPDLTPSNRTIAIRYYNGCTPEIFRDLLDKYWKTIQSGAQRKEEKEWLQSFMH